LSEACLRLDQMVNASDVPRLIATVTDMRVLQSVLAALSPNSKVLDIGTGNAGSAILFAIHKNVDSVITIDPFKSDAEAWVGSKERCERFLRDYPTVTLLPITSEEAFKDELLTDFDLVYVDGDHRFEAVKFDIEAWRQRLKPEGYLIGHDYGLRYPSVKKAVNETLDEVYVSKLIRCTVWADRPVGKLRVRLRENVVKCSYRIL